MRTLAKILTLFLWLPGSMAGASAITDSLRYLPVQDAGRIKPYDTFATEMLKEIHGKSYFVGRDGAKKEAIEVVTTWMVIPEPWDQVDLIEVRHKGLRDALQLEETRFHYSPKELLGNTRLPLLLQELRTRRDQGEKLNPYFQAVARLEGQIATYQAIKSGLGVRVMPAAEADGWVAVSELQGPAKERFQNLAIAFVKAFTSEVGAGAPQADKDKAKAELEGSVADFVAMARAANPQAYASDTRIKLEVHYNRFHPILWTWVAYLMGILAFAAHLVNGRGRWRKLGWAMMGVGFLLHIYGMGLRIYLAGRPPVSNMYETVVWVPWGTLVFAALIYRRSRNLLIMIAASVVAVLCLILTDLSPTVLDASIHPLEPVLRSTFWLTTHVLIISISYAAFFLAFALGDWVLYCYLRDEKKYGKAIFEGVQAIYRAIQIGAVLLATGIILGGVWADYSWGRFWGWDPKETWALIAFLGYVALLHGRLAGWIRGFGMAAGSVIAFSLVIMAWYGVNFVLGAGLHTYGFGAGGVEYVSGFVMLHLLYVAFVAAVRRSRLLSAQAAPTAPSAEQG
jgi:cytochrome c-type biogenesis protein CcsB